jgi:hypothetical protein
MPDDMPDVYQPDTDTPIVAQPGTPEEDTDEERDSWGRPTREADPKEASGTRHTPGEEAGGWKSPSEAGKDDSDDPRP